MKKVIALFSLAIAGSFASASTWAANLESPAHQAGVSGIGFIGGWKCDASNITVTIDGGEHISVAMGQPPLGAWGSGGRGASPKRPASSLGGVPRIIDADTLELSKQRVRLQGIDAPESAQSCRLTDGRRYQCGKQATAALRTHLGRAAIRCAIDGRDRYGRGLGTCYTSDGTNLNAWLVQQGHALAYRQYSTEYVPDEDHARAGRVGLWGGEFVPPWEWRRGKRLN